jgi:lysophospholipase L1-like esterase
MLSTGTVVVFQGDSITDGGRDRKQLAPHAGLGSGYVMMAVARLLAEHPRAQLRCYNRGVSGNRFVDLYARIRADVINLRPDILSVLIGVNDTWHEFDSRNGVPVPKYQRLYREFLAEVRAELPAIRFILCEPFVLRCGVVTDAWQAEMEQRRQVVRQLADEFGARWVPFQRMFDEAVREAPPQYWATDGVHPTLAGHYRMAQTWMEAVQ